MSHRYLAGAILFGCAAAACSGRGGDGNYYSSLYDPPPSPNDGTFEGTDEPPTAQKGPAPDFSANITQANAPPPLTGGTLIVSKDGTRVVAADPDRDQVYIVALADKSVTTVALQPHDEPGRLIEDASGRAHVVLRGAGGIATIDLATSAVLSRRAICPAPRGVAFDATGARLLVTCEDGQIVQAGTAPDAVPTAFQTLDRDLRDIVIDGTRILVSRFRAAEMIELDSTGAVVARTQLTDDILGGTAVLAWRMIAPFHPGEQPMIVHQAATSQPVDPQPGGYGSGVDVVDVDSASGGGIVNSEIFDGDQSSLLPTHAVLPVDMVFDGSSFAVVAAGNGHTKSLPQVFILPSSDNFESVPSHLDVKGQATSIALLPSGTSDIYAVLSREPAQLELLPSGTVIPLSNVSREDTGHAIFHSNSGSGLACASCHGEARDDGHVWNFDNIGERRTPSMLGTLQGTAPYHWDGNETGIPMLVDDVMTGRMNGPTITPAQKDNLQSWLFALPAPPAPIASDAAAVERGRLLFTSAAVGCSTCHAGARFTNSGTFDVGTGGRFQVPSLLGVGARAPYLHDGRAVTLTDRFNPVLGGGDQHGMTSALSSAQIADLVAYLGTL